MASVLQVCSQQHLQQDVSSEVVFFFDAELSNVSRPALYWADILCDFYLAGRLVDRKTPTDLRVPLFFAPSHFDRVALLREQGAWYPKVGVPL